MMCLRRGVERETISHDIARPVERGLIGIGRQMVRKGAHFIRHLGSQETAVMGNELRHRGHEIAELGGRREALNGPDRRLLPPYFCGDGDIPAGRPDRGARRLAAMGAEYRLMYHFHRLGALHGFVRERRRQGKIGTAHGPDSADLRRH